MLRGVETVELGIQENVLAFKEEIMIILPVRKEFIYGQFSNDQTFLKGASGHP
jgi:hypothetical protein